MIQVRALDSTHGTATWESTLIHVWRGRVTPEAAAGFNLIARSFLKDARKPITTLYVVEPSSPPPGDLARAELATWSREIVPKTALAVIVAEGGGFRSALVRGVGITLTALMPHRLQLKFVGELDQALALLRPHLPLAAGGSEGLRGALNELREAMANRGTRPINPDRP
jgi:hypothetical protein